MSTETHTTLEEAIEAAKQGRRTVLLCPAHDDRSPSLSVGPGDKQPVLINCHAGCDPHDVIQAAGLDIDILLMPRDEMDAQADWVPGDPQPSSSAVYPYRDADGTLLYEVIRANYADGTKRFFQRQPNPDYGTDHPNPEHRGPHIWKLDGVKRVPFNLPQLVEAIAAAATVHVAEGEKCVRALERVIPAEDVATCNSGGAGKWAGEFNHYFTPGTRVIIYADADDKGRAHAREVRENLMEAGCVVRTVEAPPGQLRGGKPISDVADHLEAGRSLASMIETTPESDAERARTGVDILDLVQRPRTPTKWVWEGTLAASERLLLVGLEGRGKSTLLRQAACMTAAGLHPFFGTRMEPKRVLFIDGENHPDQVTDSWANLVGLCVRHASPIEPGMLTVLEEWDGDRDLTSISGATWARERVFGYRPDLIILGPLTNLVERDLSEYEQVNRLRKTVDSLREVCGSAIVMEHHAPLRGNGDKIREVRPYGNGLFLKWPDYGYAMVPTDNDGVYEWRANRGPRVRSRRFPAALRHGDQHVNSIEFPFMEAEPI